MRQMSYIASTAIYALLLLSDTVSAQTWSKCNPTQQTGCPADTALGMTINVDFSKGAVNSFAASGTPSYSRDGVSFSVAKSGDAPQLDSLFYIMFGRVEITMKAAPGAGIVSSVVLQSDTLDEIDIEWLGADPDRIQSNYFGKGKTTSHNRAKFHNVPGTQANWITYTIDWTKDRIVWMAGKTVLRTLTQADAEANQYPQTPMQVKFGAWAGGDPSTNAAGTVQWARGPTDFSKGPFTMMVQKVIITDYSTGKQYEYSDSSGSWQSIKAIGGQVNGNFNNKNANFNNKNANFNNKNAITVTATASGTAPTTFVSVPVGGIAKDGSPATATQTGWPWVGSSPTGYGSIPSGWYMTPEGKIMRSGSTSIIVPSLLALMVGPFLIGVLTFVNRIY